MVSLEKMLIIYSQGCLKKCYGEIIVSFIITPLLFFLLFQVEWFFLNLSDFIQTQIE